jgi:hypothetical protein
MRIASAATLLGLAAAGLATPALAQSLFDRVSGPGAGSDPCFARSYDAEHLRRNPRQRVAAIHLVRERVEVASENGPRRFTVRVGFRLRSGAETFSTLAICTPAADGAACAGEGDTGSFRIAPAGEGLRLTIARLEVEGENGSSPDLARSDDRVFALRPARAGACAAD